MLTRASRLQRLIPAYLEGSLPDSKRRWLERCVKDDPTCAERLRSYQRLHQVVHKARVEYPSESAWDQFLPVLHRRIAQDAGDDTEERDGPWRRWGFDAAIGGLGGAVCGAIAAFAVVFVSMSLGLFPARTEMLSEPRTAAVSSREPEIVSQTQTPNRSTAVERSDDAAQRTVADASESDEGWVLEDHRAPIDLYADSSSYFTVAWSTP